MKTYMHTIGVLVFLISTIFPTFSVAEKATNGGSNNINNQPQAQQTQDEQAGPRIKETKASASKVETEAVSNPLDEALRMEKALKIAPCLIHEKHAKHPAQEWKAGMTADKQPQSYVSIIEVEGKKVVIYYILPSDKMKVGCMIFMWNESERQSPGEEISFDWTVSVDFNGKTTGGVGPNESKVCILTEDDVFGGKIVNPQYEKFWQGVADERISKALMYFEGYQVTQKK